MTFQEITDEVIFGTYFFLDEMYLRHEMKRYTLINFASVLGGLFSAVIGGFGLILIPFNKKATSTKVI